MRRWMATALLWAACNGDKDGESGLTGETGDTQPDPQTSTGPERVATILALTGDPTAGQATYTAVCAACHGTDGTGVPPSPALTERVPTLTDDQVVSTILEGKGNMDSYRFLENQDIADVLAFVRTHFGS
jgi:mono/diheme cytochrome c family protein